MDAKGDYRALSYKFIYSHDANVDVSVEINRLELPLAAHPDGTCALEAPLPMHQIDHMPWLLVSHLAALKGTRVLHFYPYTAHFCLLIFHPLVCSLPSQTQYRARPLGSTRRPPFMLQLPATIPRRARRGGRRRAIRHRLHHVQRRATSRCSSVNLHPLHL